MTVPVPNPATVTSKAHLRAFAVPFLTRWITDLDDGKIRLHFPRRRGLMRLIPGMPFHLRPEMFLQISGYTAFQFPEESCRVGPGEICLVSRGLPHRETVGGARDPFFNVVIAYLPDRIHLHLAHQDTTGNPGIVVSMELQPVDGDHLADLLKNTADWFHQGDLAHRFAIKGSLLANLSSVLAAIEKQPTGAHEPLKVMQVRQLIMHQLSRPEMSVEWIGRSLQSSPDYLSSLFRKTTGLSLMAFITERRMVRARELLTSSTLNIAEVSLATGYEDPSYFTRVFRKECGLSPRQYRAHALKHPDWAALALQGATG